MTQAFNLSQLANGVNTSGQLNAAANLYNQVPVANGGTGAATLTANAVLIGNGTSAVTAVAAGTAGNVLTSNGTTWTSSSFTAGTSVNAITVGTASGTWTKPATVKSIKVTVVGGGGTGGIGSGSGIISQTTGYGGAGGGGGTAIRYYPAASIPGPQPYTVGGAGGTSSFGVAPITVVSATGGGAGGNSPSSGVGTNGSGGAGSNGAININGGNGYSITDSPPGSPTIALAFGNSSLFSTSGNAVLYGGGGFGGRGQGPASNPGTTGAAGVVIIEEFY